MSFYAVSGFTTMRRIQAMMSSDDFFEKGVYARVQSVSSGRRMLRRSGVYGTADWPQRIPSGANNIDEQGTCWALSIHQYPCVLVWTRRCQTSGKLEFDQ